MTNIAKTSASIHTQTNPEQREEKVLGAARMYEQMFLREMVRSMRKSVSKSDMLPEGMGEQIFREQLDDEYVDKWSTSGGVGLADIIYDHIMEKYGRRQIRKPEGPLPLTPAKDLKPLEIKRQQSDSNQDVFKIESTWLNNQPINNPWPGTITEVNHLDGNLKAYLIDHDNGLESTLVFSGLAMSLTKGQRVNAGQKLGISSSKELLWRIS